MNASTPNNESLAQRYAYQLQTTSAFWIHKKHLTTKSHVNRDDAAASTTPHTLDDHHRSGQLGGNFTKIWSSLSVQMDADTLEDMQLEFRELHPMYKHIGLDDMVDITKQDEGFLATHIGIGEAVIAGGSVCAARQFCKHGVVPSLRPKLWDLMLQSDLTESYSAHAKRTYNRLKVMTAKYDLLIDRLIQIDAKLAGNDDSYFVFEEILREILILWTRDVWLRKAVTCDANECSEYAKEETASRPKSANIPQSQPAGGLAADVPMGRSVVDWTLDSPVYPPNGIYPFWGISLYAMPVCYLHEDPAFAYMTFRELYARYFHNLHTISARPGTLLHLCQTFEDLLKQADAVIFHHLSATLSYPPLDLVFKWILYGFVGVLDCEQVMLLWDRILGFDSLNLLPLTAVALLVFRRDMILQSETTSDIEVREIRRSCFSEISTIKWVPLVQNLLFVRTPYMQASQFEPK
eukprot:jgi/Hompol1/2106/HPOL_005843-RA